MRNLFLRIAIILATGFLPSADLCAALADTAQSKLSPTVTQCFPASVKGLNTVTFSETELASAKADRNTILAGYTGQKNKLTITAYIYDRESKTDDADLEEMRRAAADILVLRTGAELVANGDAKIHIGENLTDALVALFFWSDSDGDYRSFLWLLPFKEHYIKLRVTYNQPKDDNGETTRYVRDMTFELTKGICQLESKTVLTTQSR